MYSRATCTAPAIASIRTPRTRVTRSAARARGCARESPARASAHAAAAAGARGMRGTREGDGARTLAVEGAVVRHDRRVHRLVQRLQLEQDLLPLHLVRLDGDGLEREHGVGGQVQDLLHHARGPMPHIVQDMQVVVLDVGVPQRLERLERRRRGGRGRGARGGCSGVERASGANRRGDGDVERWIGRHDRDRDRLGAEAKHSSSSASRSLARQTAVVGKEEGRLARCRVV